MQLLKSIFGHSNSPLDLIITFAIFCYCASEVVELGYLLDDDISYLLFSDLTLIQLHHLFTEGFKEAAEKFQQESGTRANADLGMLADRVDIREAIQEGRIEEAIAKVNDIHPELLDNDRYLYFHLQV